ncbi:MAG TPA: bifunctional phosphoglucose/phosphomannose isomerase [Actinobacteria bacterium]|nr:bifunctional phosphoglucose/phosphomannose isomerase [Actinomycetota bacterium]
MSEMFDRIFELPAQLRHPVDRVAVRGTEGPIVMLGMGGSGMAAAVAALGVTDPGRIVAVHRSYGLPAWAGAARATIVAVSYSGNTEETVSGVVEALELGLTVVAVTSGGRIAALAEREGLPLVEVPAGLQPRAAVGYQVAAATTALEGLGAVDDLGALEEGARVLDELLGDGSGPAVTLGRDLAEAMEGRVPAIYGGFPVGGLAAYRWKTQINENTKRPAWSSEVPELDHNELQGWDAAGDLRDVVGVVHLRDAHDHPRVVRRFELMEAALRDEVPHLGTVHSQGDGPVARFFSLAVVGDVASVVAAEALGVDPEPVPLLEDFKRRLKESE